MHSALKEIPLSELKNISGGHCLSGAALGVLGVAWLVVESAHMFVGLREFWNYAGERMEYGCECDSGDYFTRYFCDSFWS